MAGHEASAKRDDMRQIGVIRLAVWGEPEDIRAFSAGRFGRVEDATDETLNIFGIVEAK